MKYTKGPWVIFDNGSDSGCREIGRQGKQDGSDPFDNGHEDVCVTVGHYHDETDLANARLIAAAPDLLDACCPELIDQAARIVEKSGLMHNGIASALRGMVEKQRSAIAKAESK
jgi:hypothetical protein